MLIGHQSALKDGPKLYTFRDVISSTQGFTIGSSLWNASCKAKRKAAGTALGRPMMKSYFPMSDLESFCIVRDSNHGQLELSIRPYIQRYALNTTLTLCYGIRMHNVYGTMLREILEVGSAISLMRSAFENYQDYIPPCYLPRNEKTSQSRIYATEEMYVSLTRSRFAQRSSAILINRLHRLPFWRMKKRDWRVSKWALPYLSLFGNRRLWDHSGNVDILYWISVYIGRTDMARESIWWYNPALSQRQRCMAF